MAVPEDLWRELDTLGEDKVRTRLAQRVYGEQKEPLVRDWLAARENAREHAHNQRSEDREDSALQLATQANSIARSSNQTALDGNLIARRSNYIAGAALVVSLVSLLLSTAAFCSGK